MSDTNRKCPECGTYLDLELRMRVQDEVPRWAPVLACPQATCPYACWGELEGQQAVFLVPEAT